MVRGLGCNSNWYAGKRKKERKPCQLEQDQKGRDCPTCGTKPTTECGGRVIIEQRIVGVKPRTRSKIAT